jgi:hypothetical protein
MIKRIVAGALASGALIGVVLGMVAGCGSSGADSCDAKCNCAGTPGNDTCLKTCEDLRTKNEDAAKAAGCTQTFDDAEACTVSKARCLNGQLDTTGSCDTQVSAHLSCIISHPGGGTTGTGK